VHASGLGLDVADTFSDTLHRDHARSQADRIATPRSRLTATRPTTDIGDLIVVDLKNRADQLSGFDEGKPRPWQHPRMRMSSHFQAAQGAGHLGGKVTAPQE
jgi:hypothetical protein